MKLLIIDDNKPIRQMIKDILENKFEHIYEHHDGLGAEEKYTECMPDFVVIDIKMKNVDGIQATKNIIKKYPQSRIIVISQYSDEETINESYSAGAIKFISKENLTDLIDFFQ